MNKRKLISAIVLVMMIFPMIFGGNSSVLAQTNPPPGQVKDKDEPPKITQVDREAAADRAEAGGFSLDDVTLNDVDMTGAAPRYFSHPNYANSPLPGNIVSEWNAIAQEFLQPSGMTMTMGGISMSASFVYLSYVQAAVYNALVAIEGGYTIYDGNPAQKIFLPFIGGGVTDGITNNVTRNVISDNLGLTEVSTASREAAVATAAYMVLSHYFPGDPGLAQEYKSALDSIADGPEKTAGIAIGQAAADGIIALRSNDILSGSGGYVRPDPGPGVWEPTAFLPDGVTPAPPMDPWMAQLKPFLRSTPDYYRSAPPPDLTDPEYASNDPQYLADFAEVKEYGGTVSASRTPEQLEVAKFWTTNMVIQTNAAYRKIAEDHTLNLLDTARLMALGNMVATDSLIATFDTKYFYSFWRPVTAIQHTNEDGTYSETPVNSWMPAVMTPNFPEYVTGHSSFVSAQAELFTRFFGTDQFNLDLQSTATGKTRHYTFADDMRTEVVNARTWGGLHFRTSSELAVDLGQQLVKDAYSVFLIPAPSIDEHANISGGIRKFVDELAVFCDPSAGLCEGTGTLGQYLPIAVPEVVNVNGQEADYYEIALVQYREKMHSDLPPTLLRGYVQVSTDAVPGEYVQLTNANLDGTETVIPGFFGVTKPHYLGPTIIATKNRPVRIKFYNLLPTTAEGGNLFIPVDTTVMGSGMAPDGYGMVELDPQNPMCGATDWAMKAQMVADGLCYSENRATLHLHGGITPWISDGTPHQWITPANEDTPYPQGVSVSPVPDMDDDGNPTDGAMTFYYTNQQSARLMFYHDHSWGITRLNVYAGEAAPYIITDETEQSLINSGLIPGAESTLPLIVQDKTFVPGTLQLAASDETWNKSAWGTTGNLWLPHVYSPAQNPGDSSGVNQFGRWAYGPWFWPPTTNIEYGPVANPYYDPECDPDIQWCEPPLMPGVPFNSMGMEAFMDTPVVNGTVYPTLTVDPKAYRFRVLNAANDRFFNLSLYMAVDANGNLCDLSVNPEPVAESTGVTCTEVALNPAEVAAALEDPTIFPTPLAGTEGPEWVQIGTEGGFLPAPAVIPAQPITWVNDPTVFNAGNVDLHSLLIGPAERADVIVDFSNYAGQTLILYNDAPAAFPARDPRYDYYTGNGDYRDTGGAPSTLAGYGPNTRTVMQIKVAAVTPEPEFNLTALQNAFAHQPDGSGVFESSQHPIIVGQGAYNSAYGTSFRNSGPLAGLVQIFDTMFTFRTLLGDILTMPLQPKQIQDEMGEAFDPEYGRMSGFLGLETPNATAGAQNMLLYGFIMPPTEVLRGIQLPPGVELEPIAATDDGTQLWKITHNGVDTHPIHFHLYDVQVINRVGWDGIIRKPDANELGWKDTVRISPLEDTIVALRPLIPQVPWDLPNSVRLLDPSMPEGVPLEMGMPIFDPSGQPVEILNHYVNFGWEYVWHCHILSHEEMDMMRSVVVGVRPRSPINLVAVLAGEGETRQVILTWEDQSINETHFTVQRANAIDGIWVDIAVLPIDSTTYADTVGNSTETYLYRVLASNTVGDTAFYAAPSIGFPNTTMDSEFSNTVEVQTALPAAPTDLSTVLEAGPQILLTWTDNSLDETGFQIERSIDGINFSILDTAALSDGVGTVNFIDTAVTPGDSYTYRVAAVNVAGISGYSNLSVVDVPLLPLAPLDLAAVLETGPQVVLIWTDNSDNEDQFIIERSTDGILFSPLVSVAAEAGTGTVMTFSDNDVIVDSSYYYRIAVINLSGQSDWVDATPFPILVQ